MLSFKAAEWRINGSSGETVTVGTPNLQIKFGGSRLKLPIKNTRTAEDATLLGYGGGIGAGISLADTPLTDWVNVTISTSEMPSDGSTSEMPSDGIGRIYRKESSPQSKPYTPKEFTGVLTILSGGGSVAAAEGSLCMAIWQKYPLAQCVLDGWKSCDVIKSITSTSLLLNPTTMPAAVAQATHAIGFFYGVAGTTDLLGAGVNAFTYNMSV